MKKAIFGMLLTLAGLLSNAMPASAELDAVAMRMQQNHPVPLRWDNVEGSPWRIAGEGLHYSPADDMHLARLKKGESVVLLVPAGAMLRIVRPEAPLSADQLDVQRSDGTGLFMAAQARPTSDPHSLLVAPARSRPCLVRVSARNAALSLAFFLSRTESTGVSLAYRGIVALDAERVGIRRADQRGSRTFWHLPASQAIEAKVRGPARLQLEHRMIYGPNELRLHQDYRIEVLLDGKPWRTMLFESSLDTVQPIYVGSAWFVGGQRAALGQLEAGYLEVLEGEHTLSLVASAPLYARLLRLEEPDYLFARLNAPTPDAATVRAQLASATLPGIWSMREDTVKRLAHSDDPAAIELAAARIARDNHRRDGGLVAAALMRRLAEKHPQWSKLDALAELTLLRHSFYRDVRPQVGQGVTEQAFYWFIPRSLADPTQPRMAQWFESSMLRAGIQGLAGGYFTRLDPARNRAANALEYRLPPRSAASRLRISWTQAAAQPSGQGLWLQLDQQPPIHLQWQGMHKGDVHFRPTRAEAAIERLGSMFGKERASTLDGPFAAFREPAWLANVASLEIDLPARVQQVRIWRDAGAKGTGWVALQYRASAVHQLSESPYLGLLDGIGAEKGLDLFRQQLGQRLQAPGSHARYAVQVGGYRDRQMAEDRVRTLRKAGFDARIAKPLAGSSLLRIVIGDYATMEAARGAQYRLIQSGFADAFVTEVKSVGHAISPRELTFNEAELVNEWQPMLRLMLAQNRLLNVPESAGKMMIRHGRALDQARQEQLIAAARKAEAQKDWLAALQSWGALAAGSKGEHYRQAQEGRIRALQALGERALAWRLQQALFLYDEDPILRQTVWQALKAQAQAHGRMRALLPLIVAAVLRHDSVTEYRALVEAFALSGEPRMALELALLLPEDARPWNMMALAGYRLGWMETLQRAMRHLPAAQQAIWQGYLHQLDGHYDDALRSWRSAGKQGELLAELLEQGIAIRRQLDAKTLGARRQAIKAWWEWMARIPGPSLWREMPSAIVASAGTELVDNVERGIVFYGARSEKDRPVRLRFAGPVDIRLEVRPIHPASGHQAIDDWILLREGKSLRPVPIIRNIPVPSLEIAGRPWVAGRGMPLEYHFGPGLHEVEVAAEHTPLLVRVFAKRPALPLSVLPPVTPQTLTAALDGRWDGRKPEKDWQHLLAREVGKLAPASTRNDVALKLGQRDIAKLLAMKPADDELAVLELMRALVWIKEHDPAHAQQALASGEALFARHAQLPGMSALHARLVAGTIWVPQRMVENSAGMQLDEVEGWQPESLRQRVRQTLMPKLEPSEVVMPGYQQVRVIMDNVRPTTLHLRLGAINLPLVEPLPMQVVYRLDDGKAKSVMLNPEDPVRQVRVQVPEGRHFVTIALRDALPDQYLRLFAYEYRNRQRVPIALRFERTYYAASRREPVVLNVQGPMWLRVEERSGRRSQVSFRFIHSGWHRLVFRPKGSAETSYRFAARMIDKAAMARLQHVRPLPPMPAVHPVAGPLLAIDEPVQPRRFELKDGFELGGQEDGTWSVGLSGHRRLNAAADRLQAAPVAKFTQLDVWYRYFDAPGHRYFRTQGLLRRREHGDWVAGLTERIYMNKPSWPATLRIDGSLYGERFAHFNAAQHPGVSRTEWSGMLQLTALRRQYLNPKWYHVPLVTAFVRHVSMKGVPRRMANGAVVLDPPPGLVGRIDTDVYTTYKEQHRYGLGFAESLVYRPWLDTILRASVGWRGNEKLLDTDHLTAALRWDQRLGDAQFNVGYRWTRYMADRDRLRAATVRQLDLALLWDLWQEHQTRWELSLAFRHYWTQTRENVGMIGLTVHFGEGRMYRDFMPGELDIPDFLDLRQRRIPQTINNNVQGIRP